MQRIQIQETDLSKYEDTINVLGKYYNITLTLSSKKKEDKITASINHVTLWTHPSTNNRIKLNGQFWIADGKMICSGQLDLIKEKYIGRLPHMFNQFIDIIDINTGNMHRLFRYGLDSDSVNVNNGIIEANVKHDLGYQVICRWNLSGKELDDEVQSTVAIVKSLSTANSSKIEVDPRSSDTTSVINDKPEIKTEIVKSSPVAKPNKILDESQLNHAEIAYKELEKIVNKYALVVNKVQHGIFAGQLPRDLREAKISLDKINNQACTFHDGLNNIIHALAHSGNKHPILIAAIKCKNFLSTSFRDVVRLDNHFQLRTTLISKLAHN